LSSTLQDWFVVFDTTPYFKMVLSKSSALRSFPTECASCKHIGLLLTCLVAFIFVKYESLRLRVLLVNRNDRRVIFPSSLPPVTSRQHLGVHHIFINFGLDSRAESLGRLVDRLNRVLSSLRLFKVIGFSALYKVIFHFVVRRHRLYRNKASII
jgi:hypothetical protein